MYPSIKFIKICLCFETPAAFTVQNISIKFWLQSRQNNVLQKPIFTVLYSYSNIHAAISKWWLHEGQTPAVNVIYNVTTVQMQFYKKTRNTLSSYKD